MCLQCEAGKYTYDFNECYECIEGATCLGGSNI